MTEININHFMRPRTTRIYLCNCIKPINQETAREQCAAILLAEAAPFELVTLHVTRQGHRPELGIAGNRIYDVIEAEITGELDYHQRTTIGMLLRKVINKLLEQG